MSLLELPDVARPMSPFTPLLSQFYKTVTSAFMENQTETLRKLARTFTLLASTLEQYATADVAKTMAKTFSPLLPIMFTFFDSMTTALTKDIHIMFPILFFLLKNTSREQFLLYYDMLSFDTQLSFFDFLVALTDPEMIKSVAASCDSLSDRQTSYEIISRIALFIMFLRGRETASEAMLHSLFTLLTHMLEAPHQAQQSFHVIFSSLAFFVDKFLQAIFVDQTTLITVILTPIVAITKRKLLAARTEAIGFILWLLDKEKQHRPNMNRCHLAIEYAVCTAYFSTGDCIPFWQYLPPTLGDVAEVYEGLVKAMTVSGMYQNQIRALMESYFRFTNFPSIRANIYQHIIRVNTEHNDHCSAFVAQWKLSALIAEVFKLKNQEIKGISGSKPFPFVVNEPTVDLSEYPPDSAYLVLQSDIFTEEALSQSMQRAMNLALTAGFHWLIGDITEILFKYLETQRQFSLLKDLYEKMTEPFGELQKSESVRMGFARIFASGPTAASLQFTEAIHLFPRSAEDKQAGFTQFISEYAKGLIGKGKLFRLEDDAQPLLAPPRENCCQICHVKPVRRELLKLSAVSFSKDVLGADNGWNAAMVQRYFFVTESPLPACGSVVMVKSHQVIEIKKSTYFEDKLTRFKNALTTVLMNIEAVLPPGKMAKGWSQSVLGLSAAPIVKFMKKIIDASPKTHPYYVLVRSVLTGEATEDAPDKISQLIDQIRKLFLRGIKIIEPLSEIQALLPGEKAVLLEYDKFIGASMEWLNK
jgi:hypothetical protein